MDLCYNKNMERQYIAIDLKSYYASVECVERGLNPLTTNLVVADESRTEKTICLAVSPSLKSAVGSGGRARLFEIVEKVRQYNARRLSSAPGHVFTGESHDSTELRKNPSLKLTYLVAKPRMGYYMDYSTRIFGIYTRFISAEDIHVYSIDEVFIDATAYLKIYNMSARELAMKLVHEVLTETGVTATAGIGTNLYLAKIAMDIVAKHMEPDEYGVRVAELDEMSYRRELWCHRPLTDFWRVGKGIARKLENNGLFTMGDVARCSIGKPYDHYNEELLYKLFGVNAQLLIDHAWGFEDCTIADIKAFKPETNSLSQGQVLSCPYPFEKARLIVREMAVGLSLDLTDKRLVTDRIDLTVCYDSSCMTDPIIAKTYKGPVTDDWYGKPVPKPAHSFENLNPPTFSTRAITEAALRVYDRAVEKGLLVRRIYIVAQNVVPEEKAEAEPEQLSLFTDYEAEEKQKENREKEKKRQLAILDIKKRYGKNAILMGMNFEEGATAIERNGQVGGHKA